MRRLALVFGAVLALAGCPGPGGGAVAVPGALAPGTKLRYVLHAGPGANEVHEVVEVTPTEVVSRVRVEVGGTAIGEPLERRFPLLPSPADLGDGQAGAPLRLGPLAVDTWTVTQDGVSTTWAVRGRTPVYPGIVKVMRGEELLVELVAVDP